MVLISILSTAFLRIFQSISQKVFVSILNRYILHEDKQIFPQRAIFFSTHISIHNRRQKMSSTDKEKILILGGNTAQVPLITAAKNEGYHVVLCDYTTTNPGIALADTHHQENFMNREEVLRIAQAEGVRGIISNSEAAMPVVAYVCEKMGLVGNTVASVETLTSKKKFRDLQHRLGMFAPECVISSSFGEALEESKALRFPAVMKPEQSSGSRGTTVIASWPVMKNYAEEWEACSKFSRSGQVVIEEYVEMPSLDDVIDGDIFMHGDIFLWDGLFTSKRSKSAPIIPITQTYPPVLTDEELAEVKASITALLKGAGITFGAFNVELYYTSGHKLFCIEINARQGGNNIPVMVRKHSEIDMYKLLVTTSMGHDDYLREIAPPPISAIT